MTTIQSTTAAYAVRIENANNWVLTENGANVLVCYNGNLSDENTTEADEISATGSPSQEITAWANAVGANDLVEFATELAAAGW